MEFFFLPFVDSFHFPFGFRHNEQQLVNEFSHRNSTLSLMMNGIYSMEPTKHIFLHFQKDINFFLSLTNYQKYKRKINYINNNSFFNEEIGIWCVVSVLWLLIQYIFNFFRSWFIFQFTNKFFVEI